MMESHALEAVRNNILGTWNLVRLAQRQGVSRLLMISSDKAVNPICVMGATKRVCERIVSAQSPKGITKSASVRFGNVLASNGSVVPIFQSQIAAGGPVRVTHPQARRYFMTISEAVSLTLQASSRSQGSEIFVLDMGEPIRIVELAENMIRLAGRVPYEDIEIQFTGLRPGEKLIEELNGSMEGLLPTDHEKMRVICEEPLSWDLISAWVAGLEELLTVRKEEAILAHLQTLVPEYTPAARPASRSINGALSGSVTVDVHDKRWPVNGNGMAHHEKNGKSSPPIPTVDSHPAVHVRE
jgi:FlaA1/EpsC-like NDP-sugar epimerase